MQRTIILFAVMALALPSAVSAKLYKCKNAQGEVVYTDKKCDGQGEELKLPPYSTYKPNIIPVPKSEPVAKDPAVSYKQLEITSPKNDDLIYSNTGVVNVKFKINGPLLSLKGHKFAVVLDGERLKSRGVTTQIRLNSVERGTHTLQVVVVDRDDKTIKSSKTISFHTQRRVQETSPTPGQTTDDLGIDSGSVGGIPGAQDTIPGGAGTIPGGAKTIPGGTR